MLKNTQHLKTNAITSRILKTCKTCRLPGKAISTSPRGSETAGVSVGFVKYLEGVSRCDWRPCLKLQLKHWTDTLQKTTEKGDNKCLTSKTSAWYLAKRFKSKLEAMPMHIAVVIYWLLVHKGKLIVIIWCQFWPHMITSMHAIISMLFVAMSVEIWEMWAWNHLHTFQ